MATRDEIQTNLIGKVVHVREDMSHRKDLPSPDVDLEVVAIYLDESRNVTMQVALPDGTLRTMYPMLVRLA